MLMTEYDFNLPKGFVDKDGNLHRKGTMRLANAKDEILPLQDPRVKKNSAYLVIILLSRVITKLGELEDVNPGVVENLFSSDLSHLQDFYRKINDNGDATFNAKCPHCKKKVELSYADLLEDEDFLV